MKDADPSRTTKAHLESTILTIGWNDERNKPGRALRIRSVSSQSVQSDERDLLFRPVAELSGRISSPARTKAQLSPQLLRLEKIPLGSEGGG